VLSAPNETPAGSVPVSRARFSATSRFEHVAIALIVAVFVALGLVYSVSTPIFEASDELWHYPVIHHLARGGGLPVQDIASAQLWRQEGSQPPLYYALGALLTAWIDTSDLPQVRRLNPHADIGVLTADGNVNMVVHTDKERFPYRGTTLAVHIVRWLSVLMGAVTVLLTYHIARAVFISGGGRSRSLPGDVLPSPPGEAAVLAAALVAFNPMFLFISGSVNNDNLVVMLSTLSLWLILRLDEGPLRFSRFVWLGLVIGLAVLSKVNAMALIPLAGLALGWVAWRRRSVRLFVWGGVGVVGPVLLVAGWWLVRNAQLYGDPLGLNMLVAITGSRHPQPTLWQLAGEWRGFLWSFWGLFGGLNVPLEGWMYTFYNALSLLAISGLPVFAWQCLRRDGCPVVGWRLFLLFVWLVAVFASLVRWTLMTPASQGRLMFSALASIGVLLAIGLIQWIPRRYRRAGVGLLVAVLLGISAAVPFQVIAPAYARPQPLSPAEIQAIPNRLSVVFGDASRLMGYQVGGNVVSPGDKLAVTLYWEGLQPIERDYSVFVHLLGEHDLVVAQRDTYPGRGLWPTSLWQPGQVIADTVILAIPRSAYTPDRAQIEVGMYDFSSGERLPAVEVPAGCVGADCAARLGDNVRFHAVEIRPAHGLGAAVPNPTRFDFEGKLALIGYTLDRRAAKPGESFVLTLYWQALQPLSEDYTVFTHVLGERDAIWAQKDSQPQDGAAPTSSWPPGMVIEDQYELRLRPDTPPDVYAVEVGLYQGATGQRLGVLGEQGRLSADHVVLTRVRVLP